MPPVAMMPEMNLSRGGRKGTECAHLLLATSVLRAVGVGRRVVPVGRHQYLASSRPSMQTRPLYISSFVQVGGWHSLHALTVALILEG